MNRTFLQIIFLLFLQTPALACDRQDPVCVASTLYEKTATFRYIEIKEYFCQSNEKAFFYGVKASEAAVAELKKQNLDFETQGISDFGQLRYQTIPIDQDSVVVKISGKGILGFNDPPMLKHIDVYSLYYLIKEDGKNYCLPRNGILKGTHTPSKITQ